LESRRKKDWHPADGASVQSILGKKKVRTKSRRPMRKKDFWGGTPNEARELREGKRRKDEGRTVSQKNLPRDLRHAVTQWGADVRSVNPVLATHKESRDRRKKSKNPYSSRVLYGRRKREPIPGREKKKGRKKTNLRKKIRGQKGKLTYRNWAYSKSVETAARS